MRFTTIIAATDGSPNSAASMAVAAEIARLSSARVIALHAFEPLALLGKVEPPVDFARHARIARDLLDTDWTEALRTADVAYEALVVEDRPADAILEVAQANNADLIVVGARGLGPLQELLLGSTTQELLASAKCPVLVTPTGCDVR